MWPSGFDGTPLELLLIESILHIGISTPVGEVFTEDNPKWGNNLVPFCKGLGAAEVLEVGLLLVSNGDR